MATGAKIALFWGFLNKKEKVMSLLETQVLSNLPLPFVCLKAHKIELSGNDS